MSDRELTIDALKQILRDAAGVDEEVNLDGDIADREFTDLGYDSLALLETGARIERAFGIRLDDDAIGSALTPRALLAVVNDQLGKQPA
jgi:act minimal PKS acyl carrier protein